VQVLCGGVGEGVLIDLSGDTAWSAELRECLGGFPDRHRAGATGWTAFGRVEPGVG